MKSASSKSSKSNSKKHDNSQSKEKAHSLYEIEHHTSYNKTHWQSEIDFNKTATKILTTNFSHHDAKKCLC